MTTGLTEGCLVAPPAGAAVATLSAAGDKTPAADVTRRFSDGAHVKVLSTALNVFAAALVVAALSGCTGAVVSADRFHVQPGGHADSDVRPHVQPIVEISRRQPLGTQLQLHRGLPFVEVATSSGPMRLILDTGSDQFIVSKEFTARTGLELIPVSEQVTDIGGRELPLNQAVVLAHMEIGSERFNRVDARVTSFGDLVAKIGRPVDGILGLRLFDNHMIDIDLSNGRLQLLAHNGRILSGGYAYHSHRGRVVVDLEIGGHVLPALIDTGDNGHIGIHDAFSHGLDRLNGVRNIRLRGFAGVSEAQEVRIKNEAWVGPWQLPNGPIRFADYPSPEIVAARIGTSVLTKFRITIDPRNELIRFVPI